MSTLDELLRGRVAYLAMRSIARDLTVQLRANGKPVPSWALPVLKALEVASGEELPASVVSAIGPPIGTIEVTNWATVRMAAQASGRSERQITRLAKARRIRAERVGERVWRVDLSSLENVIRRRTK